MTIVVSTSGWPAWAIVGAGKANCASSAGGGGAIGAAAMGGGDDRRGGRRWRRRDYGGRRGRQSGVGIDGGRLQISARDADAGRRRGRRTENGRWRGIRCGGRSAGRSGKCGRRRDGGGSRLAGPDEKAFAGGVDARAWATGATRRDHGASRCEERAEWCSPLPARGHRSTIHDCRTELASPHTGGELSWGRAVKLYRPVGDMLPFGNEEVVFSRRWIAGEGGCAVWGGVTKEAEFGRLVLRPPAEAGSPWGLKPRAGLGLRFLRVRMNSLLYPNYPISIEGRPFPRLRGITADARRTSFRGPIRVPLRAPFEEQSPQKRLR